MADCAKAGAAGALSMIGVFDSGFGGLTVLRALSERFPDTSFVYLGDHARVPYGNREATTILDWTQSAVAHLFGSGCRLVILGCNTATAVAARHLQQVWLTETVWRERGHNVLGIIAPTVEAATQTPWAVTEPQYPQKYNADRIVVFGTARTVTSGVYPEEITKRCPNVTVSMVTCAGLAGAIEAEAPDDEIDNLVEAACRGIDADRAILGCTHFPLVEHVFRAHLPSRTRILSQPEVVAQSLEDYLTRKPDYRGRTEVSPLRLLTTGDPEAVTRQARVFWQQAPAFARVDVA